MLVHPQFDPIAFSIGPLSVRWYGLMYLVGFVGFMLLGRYRIGRGPNPASFNVKDLDDLLFYGVLGTVIGGRLGQVLFYEPGYYLANPLEILAVWKGGMSFHGGLLGVILAMWLFGRHTGRSFFAVADFVAPLIPQGLAFGRIGNFINAELWGRPADPSLPWAMVFPNVDMLPRHPSQLYQAGLEGMALWILLWLFSSRLRPSGANSGAFLLGYGVFRFAAEYFRNPDPGVFGLQMFGLSMGQWLSLPMVAAGVLLMAWAYRRR